MENPSANQTSSDRLRPLDTEAPPAVTGESFAALRDEWQLWSAAERCAWFLQLEEEQAEEVFENLDSREQAQLLQEFDSKNQRAWIRRLAPDDAADVLQELPVEVRHNFEALLDKITRREVRALMAYAADEAGGLMSPRYARLRADITVDEAIAYLRRQARRAIETINYAYVLDHEQTLLGVVSLRELFVQPGEKLISEFMEKDLVVAVADTDREELRRLFAEHNLLAIPVVSERNQLQGIVTVDDALQAFEEEVTEDMQKIGGTEALDAPYLEVNFWSMVRKRAGWLSILFVGELFTASAMARYEAEIAQAVILALFIPLVISSGGNSGSQASTLIVRALALGEVRPGLWLRVFFREVQAGLALGLILGALGFLRIVLMPGTLGAFEEHAALVGLTLFWSLLGIVLWGTVAGSMLPIALKKLGLDPASASAPFVATMVDVTGLVIYFSIAHILLQGVLL